MSYYARTDLAIQKNEGMSDVIKHPYGYAIASMIKYIEIEFETTWDIIKSKSFKREVALPRMVLAYMLIKKLGLKRVEIGRLLNKHHSSITYALILTSNLIETDRKFEDRMTKIMNET
jgi:chromosomal replication initiation ATPase DnaA